MPWNVPRKARGMGQESDGEPAWCSGRGRPPVRNLSVQGVQKGHFGTIQDNRWKPSRDEKSPGNIRFPRLFNGAPGRT